MASDSRKHKCNKCGNDSALLNYSSTVKICSECYLTLNPPILRLDRYEDDADLWNRTQAKREVVMNVGDFIKCGWFLRKIKESVKAMPRFGKKELYFEFYGKCKCIRFKGYYDKLSMEDLDDCKNPFDSCKRNQIRN